MRLGSIYDSATPSGRADIVADLGAAATTLADVDRPGSGKSSGSAIGAAAFLAVPAAGAFAGIVARRDISAARPRMPVGAPARDLSAGCGGAEPAREGCGGKPAATR